jgi:hypothetical protein
VEFDMVGLLGWFMGLAVSAALVIGIASVGEAAIVDARAATAADSAALAAAAAGPEAAAEAAARNGAVIISLSVSGAVTTVEVRVGPARAKAHAERLEIRE